MRVGSDLEAAVLDLYAQEKKVTLERQPDKKLVLHGTLPYVGHTPDALQGDPSARQLIEVKVVFSDSEPDTAKLLKKHQHQIQLGIAVHQCSAAVLVVYRCQASNATAAYAAKEHPAAHPERMYTFDVAKDNDWFRKFRQKADSVYNDHLHWMYGTQFDESSATNCIRALL